MRHTPLFVSLLLASSLLYAQQDGTSLRPVIARSNFVVGVSSCPIGFTVERSVLMELVPINDGTKRARQKLRLNLSPRKGRTIYEASGIIHGTSGAGLMLPVDDGIDHEATRNFELKPQPGEPGLILAPVSQEISAIRWVELTSIKYADGTTWHASESSQCRARIDRFVLVQ